MRLLTLFVVFASLCFGLGRQPLIQPDEGRNAEVGREMKVSGAWLVPTYNGYDYLDKPAFFFRAVALSLAAFGDNEFAARLPSALFAIGLVGVTVMFCRRVYRSERVAWLAAMVLATLPLYLAHARIVIMDMTLAFFVCAAIFAGFLAEETEGASRRNWYLLGAATAGCATLVKGPVGFLVPLLVLLIAQPMAGRRGAWKRIFAPWNWLVFFGVTLPWFVGLCVRKPDFLHYGLVQETLTRFTNAQAFHRGKPFYYYGVILATTFFPWNLLLPEAALAAWRARPFKQRADLLCIVWSFVVVLFFSISQSKQPAYILSVAVSCAILVARLIDAALTGGSETVAKLLRRGVIVLVAVCLAGLAVVAWLALHPAKVFAWLKMTDTSNSNLAAVAVPAATFLVAIAAVGSVGIVRRSAWLCFVALALFWPLGLLANLHTVATALTPRSGRSAAELLRQLPPETELAGLHCYPNGVPFYLGRTLTVISDDGAELGSNYLLAIVRDPGQRPASLVSDADFERWLGSRKTPVYLIARAEQRERLEAIAAPRGAAVQPLTSRYCGVLLQTSTPR